MIAEIVRVTDPIAYVASLLAIVAACLLAACIPSPRDREPKVADAYAAVTRTPNSAGCDLPQLLSKTAAGIELSRSPAAAKILPRFPSTISLLQRRFLSGESRD
jgi:hypothetical protein